MGQHFCACRNMYSPGLHHVGGLHVENIGNRPKSSQGLPHYISSENRVNMHIAIQLHNIQMVPCRVLWLGAQNGIWRLNAAWKIQDYLGTSGSFNSHAK